MTDPSPERIEAAARALCTKAGGDPDLLMTALPGFDLGVNEWPQWVEFAGQAQTALAAADAVDDRPADAFDEAIGLADEAWIDATPDAMDSRAEITNPYRTSSEGDST